MGHRPGDALVEIWNGMPFVSPLWYRGPRIVFLHHVHAEMWGMVLPPTLARMGDLIEQRIAPRFYRSSRIVTLSDSSRREIVDAAPATRPHHGGAARGGRRAHAGRPCARPRPSSWRWDGWSRSSVSTRCSGRWSR